MKCQKLLSLGVCALRFRSNPVASTTWQGHRNPLSSRVPGFFYFFFPSYPILCFMLKTACSKVCSKEPSDFVICTRSELKNRLNLPICRIMFHCLSAYKCSWSCNSPHVQASAESLLESTPFQTESKRRNGVVCEVSAPVCRMLLRL